MQLPSFDTKARDNNYLTTWN